MRRLWITPLLFGLSAFVAASGCTNVNPILLVSYLFNNDDPKTNAEFPLKPRPHHEKEEVKIVVLTSSASGFSPDMIGVDRALAAEFIPLLQQRCTENKEKVTVKRASAIDDFKRQNPDWRILVPREIGKKLDADYVIDIEVLQIDLFEPGTRQEFMRGRARISVQVFDLSKPAKDMDPAFAPPEFNFTYPRGHEVSKFDEPITTFKQKFIKRMAGELVVPFTAHTSNQKVLVD